MKVRRKYRNTLDGYLKWVASDFLRPVFTQDSSAFSAAESMLRWEALGEELPGSTTEPDLLALYVQGKKARDFYIDNWRSDCKRGEAVPEEFLYDHRSQKFSSF